MSEKYVPLYTKYRPMIFADITGQSSTVKALTNAVQSGKVAHAFLFCGPRGTGKTSTARILAKSLNCVNGPTITPCGKCPGCLDVINSTPVDVIEIDAASNRSVEDARNILEKVRYAPVNGKYKIYIIDEVHMLTTEASNTLLKTLEEPPANVVFILATTEAHKVLETIVSRCQRYDFKRITTSDIIKRLDFIAQKEDIKIEETALAEIAKNAAGGMRDAVALLDRLSVIGKTDKITPADVNEILGKLSFEKLHALTDTISAGNTQDALFELNKIYDEGNEPGRIIAGLIKYLRDLLIIKTVTDKDLIFSTTGFNEQTLPEAEKQAKSMTSDTILYMIERLSFHFAQVKETTEKYMQVQLCIIELTNVPKVETLAELTKRVKILEDKLANGAIPVKTVQPVGSANPAQNTQAQRYSEPSRSAETPAAPEHRITHSEEPVFRHEAPEIKSSVPSHPEPTQPSSSASANSDDWAQILSGIEKMPSRMFFTNLSRPIEVSKDRIILAFSNDAAAKQADDSNKRTPLENAAKAHFGVNDIKITIKVKPDEFAKKQVIKAKEIPISPAPSVKPPVAAPSESAPDDEEEENETVAFYSANAPTSAPKTDNSQNTPETLQKPEIPENVSDTVANFINLFGGQIIE